MTTREELLKKYPTVDDLPLAEMGEEDLSDYDTDPRDVASVPNDILEDPSLVRFWADVLTAAEKCPRLEIAKNGDVVMPRTEEQIKRAVAERNRAHKHGRDTYWMVLTGQKDEDWSVYIANKYADTEELPRLTAGGFVDEEEN